MKKQIYAFALLGFFSLSHMAHGQAGLVAQDFPPPNRDQQIFLDAGFARLNANSEDINVAINTALETCNAPFIQTGALSTSVSDENLLYHQAWLSDFTGDLRFKQSSSASNRFYMAAENNFSVKSLYDVELVGAGRLQSGVFVYKLWRREEANKSSRLQKLYRSTADDKIFDLLLARRARKTGAIFNVCPALSFLNHDLQRRRPATHQANAHHFNAHALRFRRNGFQNAFFYAFDRDQYGYPGNRKRRPGFPGRRYPKLAISSYIVCLERDVEWGNTRRKMSSCCNRYRTMFTL